MFMISQSWLSASRTTDVLYGLMNSVPAIAPRNAGAPSGVASPSRKTTPLTVPGPCSAAIPTSAAPAEWPTRIGAFGPVSFSALRNARIWPARWPALNGGFGGL